MELKFKLLTDSARSPEKAHVGDLGYDVFADENVIINSGEYRLIKTGISVLCSNGKYGFLIKDRSSMACKGLFSHAGVIDNGYTGEIKVLLHYVGDGYYSIQKGDKIAQMVPTGVVEFEIQEVTEFHTTQRGNKGFGSTGK